MVPDFSGRSFRVVGFKISKAPVLFVARINPLHVAKISRKPDMFGLVIVADLCLNSMRWIWSFGFLGGFGSKSEK